MNRFALISCILVLLSATGGTAGLSSTDSPRNEPESDAAWKIVPLQTNGPGTLKWGAEARVKYELYSTTALNQRPRDHDGFWLQRYRFHAQIRTGDWLDLFGELQSSLEQERKGGPRSTDEDILDLHQGYMDLHITGNSEAPSRMTFRAGRQELSYGSQRLISVRESPNNRLAFDAVRILTQWHSWTLDAWAAQPVEVDRDVFDDQRSRDVDFWGAYGSGPLPFWKNLKADVYLLGLHKDQTRFARGQGEETRHSLGARVFGQGGMWDWNLELVGQWGSFGSDSIAAWTAASETGCSWNEVAGKPRLFVRADIASGDRGESHLETFNPLFPRGSYFNEASLIGPQNLMDLQPGISFTPAPRWKATFSTDVVWRQSLSDGTYGVAGNVQAGPGLSQARYVGTFPACSVNWVPHARIVMQLHYVAYIWGGFIRETLPQQNDGHYFSASTTLRF